jgi:uncharacterized protein YndB with AHSA1/START domain
LHYKEAAMSDEVTRETVVPAGREEVWRSLTAPGFLGDEVDVELDEGGPLRADEREGFVEEVEPERRLVFWWAAPGEDSSRVEIDLEQADTGTLVRVVESRPLELVPEWAVGPQAVALSSA